MRHTAGAHLDVTTRADARAKVGAKGVAHFDLLQDAADTPAQPIWPPPRPRPAMAIPRKRRR